LSTCLLHSRLKLEAHYDLRSELDNWQNAKRILVRETLHAICMMGGRDFSSANAKVNATKTYASAKEMEGSVTVNAIPVTKSALINLDYFT
jgi:hypothetical protein